MLLDLSAAFDTVDHAVLLSRLKHYVGIRGSALSWFNSFLTDRTFSVGIGGSVSSIAPLTCGVPQGSMLSPTLFLLYILPLGLILRVSFHLYADGTQIYLPFKHTVKKGLEILLACLNDIRSWMSSNVLHLNASKTEAIVFGPSVGKEKNTVNVGNLHSYIKPAVTSLGFTLDSSFKFDQHINTVVKSSFFHLKLLSRVS